METKTQNTSDEYLYAAIQTADWITPAYKKLAEKYKNTDCLREVYVCICDGVNIELLENLPEDDFFDALQNCRKRHQESEILKIHRESMEYLTLISKKTELEVNNLSASVQYIIENIRRKEQTVIVPNPDESAKEDVESLPDEEDTHKELLVLHKDISVRSYLNEIKQRIKEIWKPLEKSSKKTVMGMLEEGYSQEQITFILQCMSDGMSEKEIDEISSPALSIEHMELLKKIKEKEHGNR